MGGCRSLTVPAYPPIRCAGGTAPEISKTQMNFGRVYLAEPYIVQRGLRREAQMRPDAVGHQRVQSRALVHFVEMRQRSSFIKHPTVATRTNGRPIGIVQQALSQVGGGRQILETLLILNADCVAAEIVRDAHRGSGLGRADREC